MANQDRLTHFLRLAGMALAWFPLLAPVMLGLLLFVQRGVFRFDYLMPAELFPLALAGGALLLWAALRQRKRMGLIGWSLGLAVFFLFGGQALAIASGLASGATEPGGPAWLLVLASLAGYALCLLLLGIGGLLLRNG